jgi:hypothetical protein
VIVVVTCADVVVCAVTLCLPLTHARTRTQLVQELVRLVGAPARVMAGDATEMDKNTSFHAWKVRVCGCMCGCTFCKRVGARG